MTPRKHNFDPSTERLYHWQINKGKLEVRDPDGFLHIVEYNFAEHQDRVAMRYIRRLKKDKSEARKRNAKPTPPTAAEFIVLLLVSKRGREVVLGDLEEVFTRECNLIGVQRAKLRYWARALSELGPALKKIGRIAFVTAAARKLLGG